MVSATHYFKSFQKKTLALIKQQKRRKQNKKTEVLMRLFRRDACVTSCAILWNEICNEL